MTPSLTAASRLKAARRARFGGQRVMLAYAHVAIPSANSGPDQVASLSAGQHTDGETAQLVVADDVVLLANLSGLDEPLRDFGDGARARFTRAFDRRTQARLMESPWTHAGGFRRALQAKARVQPPAEKQPITVC